MNKTYRCPNCYREFENNADDNKCPHCKTPAFQIGQYEEKAEPRKTETPVQQTTVSVNQTK